MNSQLSNLAVILGMMQVAKRIPFDDPNILNLVRLGYILSNVIIAAAYFYIGVLVKRKNESKILRYTEPAPPMSTDPPKEITTTVRGYDETQLRQAFKSQAMGVAMMCVMHGYFKYSNPLFLQSIMPLKSLFENKLVQIHLLGKPARGDLARPWKAAAGLFAGLGGDQGATAGAASTTTEGDERTKLKGEEKEEKEEKKEKEQEKETENENDEEE